MFKQAHMSVCGAGGGGSTYLSGRVPTARRAMAAVYHSTLPGRFPAAPHAALPATPPHRGHRQAWPITRGQRAGLGAVADVDLLWDIGSGGMQPGRPQGSGGLADRAIVCRSVFGTRRLEGCVYNYSRGQRPPLFDTQHLYSQNLLFDLEGVSKALSLRFKWYSSESANSMTASDIRQDLSYEILNKLGMEEHRHR